MQKALSDHEVLKIAGPDITRVFIYPDIVKNINNINDLINDRYPQAIILYQFQDDPIKDSIGGHWVAVKRFPPKMGKKARFDYFDSYGKMIDQPLDVMDKNYRIKTDQIKKKLSELLYKSGYDDINYNDHQLQEHKRGINTCGRWSSYYLALGLNLDQFYDLMKSAKKKLGYKSYDKMIVDLTKDLL